MEIERTLRNDGRIYLVGGALWLGDNERAAVLPPAPESQYGWSYLPYVVSWSQQLAEFLVAHVNNGVTLPEFGKHVYEGEDVLVCQAEGWHD